MRHAGCKQTWRTLPYRPHNKLRAPMCSQQSISLIQHNSPSTMCMNQWQAPMRHSPPDLLKLQPVRVCAQSKCNATYFTQTLVSRLGGCRSAALCHRSPSGALHLHAGGAAPSALLGS